MRGAFGSGASGSSTMSTRLLVPAGTPDHASGGERSLPSQVYFAGISAPSAKAVDVMRRVTLASLLAAARLIIKIIESSAARAGRRSGSSRAKAGIGAALLEQLHAGR